MRWASSAASAARTASSSQAIGLHGLEVLDLGEGVLAQLVEPRLLPLGLLALGVELGLLGVECGAGQPVPVEVVGGAGGDDVDEGAHLDGVVDRPERVEQRDARARRVDVAMQGDLVGLGLQLVDLALGRVDLDLQLGLLGAELVELRGLVEVQPGGVVGALAGVGDLPRRLPGVGLLGPADGRDGAPGERGGRARAG